MSTTPLDDLHYWLDQLLRAEDDDQAYLVAEEALLGLGRLDPAHFRQALLARRGTVSPEDAVVLAGLLVATAMSPEVADWLESLWDQVSGPDRGLLAQNMARSGDTRFVPLLQGALLAGHLDRVEFLNARAALESLGGELPPGLQPPPSEEIPAYVNRVERAESSKAVGAMREATYHAMEAESMLRRELTRDPRAVGLVQYEALQRRIDNVLERRKARVKRFLDYCHGALVYVGVAPAPLLVDWVVQGSMLPDSPTVPEVLELAATDPRFKLHPGELLALAEVTDVNWILAERKARGLTHPPYPDFETFGLAGIGRPALAWIDEEKDAAEAMLPFLAPPYNTPEQVAQLQAEMRLDHAGGKAVLQRWSERVRRDSDPRAATAAFSSLWNITMRWELFGYALMDFAEPEPEPKQKPKGRSRKTSQ